MYNKLIIFLLRKKFGLKKFEFFRFKNQKSDINVYYFTSNALMKEDFTETLTRPANVKLNYLLSEECEIEKIR